MSLNPGYIAACSLFCVAYGVTFILASERAYAFYSTDSSLSNRRHFLFFVSIMVHCPIRITVVILQLLLDNLSSNSGYASNVMQSVITAIPAISFQTAMYIYLRIWQRQCEHLNASRPAPTIQRRYIIAWYSMWALSMGFDVLLDQTNINHDSLCTELCSAFNFMFISVGFAYLGERVSTSVVSVYGSSSAEMYEQHVRRIKWFFGLACLIHGFCSILQIWITDSPVFGWKYFEVVYYSLVELSPLLASILSIFYIQRELSSN